MNGCRKWKYRKKKTLPTLYLLPDQPERWWIDNFFIFIIIFFYLMFWWQFGSPPNEHAVYGALVLSKMEGIS